MLITNIRHLINVRPNTGRLRGSQLAELPVLNHAYLKIDDGRITGFGRMEDLHHFGDYRIVDAEGRSVLPAWCDSHSHLVFAASREAEFIDKIKGLSYAEIAAKGGGILNSARKLAETEEEVLFDLAKERLSRLIRLGTGALEIKSGYGLSTETELKMLRVIRRLKEWAPVPVKATFLGAHAIPMEYKGNRRAYIDLILQEMLPAIVQENLADYIDVFCEEGFFSQAETEEICRVGAAFGLKPKIHANQLNISGGVQAGYRTGALSVDHLETISDEEIRILGLTDAPMATLLPTAAYFLRMGFPPARRLIENNAAVVLASDFNPGSSPSGNMNMVVSMSCIQMKMLPEEAINAATLNGAYAMELEEELGSIATGKRANLILTEKIPSVAYLPYSFGENLVDQVIINGEFYE
ncbi:imidazolonepropionase [Leadbetterella sp. DM7]|uniref:imidazolonepropionase n=1 Tax=Leadbetterella sp. DM7 TaxID=3235085 RepID=UPI00349ED9B3